MQRSRHRSCSFPTCCRVVYLTSPRDINITRIYTGSCITKHEKQKYTVYYNNNQSSQYLYEDSCCHGDIYVYYDYLAHASPKTTLPTVRTGIRAASSTPPGTPPSTDVPEVPTPSDPKNTSVLVTILVCSTLLIILGVAALLYRRYRKLKSVPVKKLPDHYEYSVIDESRITAETVDDRISPTTINYFVLEVTEGPRPPTTSLSSTTTPSPCSSSEYETVQMKNEPENPSEGAYNTLRENNTLPDDTTDNYSRFADVNQEYSHLHR